MPDEPLQRATASSGFLYLWQGSGQVLSAVITVDTSSVPVYEKLLFLILLQKDCENHD
jgi:hypothetical protein